MAFLINSMGTHYGQEGRALQAMLESGSAHKHFPGQQGHAQDSFMSVHRGLEARTCCSCTRTLSYSSLWDSNLLYFSLWGSSLLHFNLWHSTLLYSSLWGYIPSTIHGQLCCPVTALTQAPSRIPMPGGSLAEPVQLRKRVPKIAI